VASVSSQSVPPQVMAFVPSPSASRTLTQSADDVAGVMPTCTSDVLTTVPIQFDPASTIPS
jgi:hypothetical protein